MTLKIITTEDGSHSLYDNQLNETYHSTRGALGESQHVFIQAGLTHWSSHNKRNEIRILEVGLGTGLNAFLTAQWSQEKRQKIHLTSLEPHPIREELFTQLNFGNSLEEATLLQKIHTTEWEQVASISSQFDLLKTTRTLEDFTASIPYDILFFDAFAPSKQPEVWSLQNLRKCFGLLNPGGILTTYCAQGQFKRDLKEAGFRVETLQGAMGKKEMVRGTK